MNYDSSSRITSYFQALVSKSQRDKAMYRFINVIIELALHVSYVEDSAFREFGVVGVNISIKELCETLFKIVEYHVRNDIR